MTKQKYHITGMTCSACSSHVEKSVSKLSGMEQVSVNLLTNSMQVSYDETTCDSAQIIEAVELAGYGASLFGLDAPSNQPNPVTHEGVSNHKERNEMKNQADHFYHLYVAFDVSIHASHVFYVAAYSHACFIYDIISWQ